MQISDIVIRSYFQYLWTTHVFEETQVEDADNLWMQTCVHIFVIFN